MKNLWIPFTLVMLLLAGCGCRMAGGTAAQDDRSYRRVSQDEAKQLMETESGYIILDVRSQEEYAQGHIPGAICVPLDTIGKEPVQELPDKEQLILVYCRSGNRSKQASQKLSDQGYTNIVEFGGINTWTGEIVKD